MLLLIARHPWCPVVTSYFLRSCMSNRILLGSASRTCGSGTMSSPSPPPSICTLVSISVTHRPGLGSHGTPIMSSISFVFHRSASPLRAYAPTLITPSFCARASIFAEYQIYINFSNVGCLRHILFNCTVKPVSSSYHFCKRTGILRQI